MINLAALRIGDIIGTTGLNPVSMAIKARLWGWRRMLDQSIPNHIAVVVDRGHGLLYLAEMLSKGIALTECNYYNHKAPAQHICFVGRHKALDDINKRVEFNNFVLKAHSIKVKYGFDDLALFLNLKVKDNLKTWICSELPREAFKSCGIGYPAQWNVNCSPRDWRDWVDMQNVTKEVV
jgi:hypothetical protein